jgi:hypothetical protein
VRTVGLQGLLVEQCWDCRDESPGGQWTRSAVGKFLPTGAIFLLMDGKFPHQVGRHR